MSSIWTLSYLSWLMRKDLSYQFLLFIFRWTIAIELGIKVKIIGIKCIILFKLYWCSNILVCLYAHYGMAMIFAFYIKILLAFSSYLIIQNTFTTWSLLCMLLGGLAPRNYLDWIKKRGMVCCMYYILALSSLLTTLLPSLLFPWHYLVSWFWFLADHGTAP